MINKNVEVKDANGNIEVLSFEDYFYRYGVMPPGIHEIVRGASKKPPSLSKRRIRRKAAKTARRRGRR